MTSVSVISPESDDAQITRTFYVDNPGAEAIVARARAARDAAGTLSGHALGEDVPLTREASILDDLRVVFATIEVDKVWSETVVEHLAQLRPGRYDDLTPAALAAMVKPYGITTGQVWQALPEGGGANRRGLTREAVMAAVERRAPQPAEITT